MKTMLKKLSGKLSAKRSGKKGFTLMEMLIVVAIIAILVAVALPTFNNALDNARKQTDAANLRAAKAVASTTYMLYESDNTSVTALTDGMVFDPDTAKFVSADKKEDTMKGKSTENKEKYIVVDVPASGEWTVSWESVT